MKKKFLKFLEVLLVLALTVGAFLLVKFVIYRQIAVDDTEVQRSYEEEEKTYELLKTTRQLCIEEGRGINIDKIPSKDIKYSIRYNTENIVFSYYIQEGHSNSKIGSATITLSKDYKVLQEKYSNQPEDFETFSNNYQWLPKILSSLYAMVVVLLIYIITLTTYIMKKKAERTKMK